MTTTSAQNWIARHPRCESVQCVECKEPSIVILKFGVQRYIALCSDHVSLLHNVFSDLLNPTQEQQNEID